jgi:RNA polymerase sigma factor (sigma-70 family)
VDDFPETTWGMIAGIKDPRARAGWRAGIETLCRRYWTPICSYARAAWASNDDDARDLTQEFFVWLIEQPAVLEKFEPTRGSFRLYVKGLLRNFGRNADHAARRKKRGGDRKRVPLDQAPEPAQPDEALAAAERAFDEAFVRAVTERALERLRAHFGANDRGRVRLAVFEAYDLASPDGRPTHAAIAAKLAIKEKDVQHHLYAARDRMRDEIRAELADTVSSQRDLESEWQRFVGG